MAHDLRPLADVMSLDEVRRDDLTIEDRRADIIRSAARGQGSTFIAAKLDLLIAAAARPLDGWRSIATAPKDGTRLLVYGCEFHRHWFGTGYYFKGVPGDGEGWIAHSFYTAPTNDSSGSFRPTHWMPLPPPPSLNAAATPPDEAC